MNIKEWMRYNMPVRRKWRCIHSSHALRLPCLRPWTYQSMCGKHNDWRCNPTTGREPDACAFWKRTIAEYDRKQHEKAAGTAG